LAAFDAALMSVLGLLGIAACPPARRSALAIAGPAPACNEDIKTSLCL
jgi:hypothetical protein